MTTGASFTFSTSKPQPKRGILEDTNSPNISANRVVNFFDEEDDEAIALQAAKDSGIIRSADHNEYKSIEEELMGQLRKLRKQYPNGGIKTSRIITTDILIKVPRGYFERFDKITREVVNWVQTEISTAKQSEIISKASEDPTNDGKQDDAYRTVRNLTNSYLDEEVEADRYAPIAKNREIDRAIINSLVCNEIIGFGKIDPLWRDKGVNEIFVNGPYDIQVEVNGMLQQVPGCTFRDRPHLSALIERLYSAIGKIVSRTNPIVDGRLHDNSRMAIVHESVAPDGPNFSIRRHKDEYVSAEKLIGWGAGSQEMMAVLGNLIHKGCSILVVGGTSSGKTTLLSALSGFFRPDHRILTLEDNIEMQVAPGKLKAAAMECIEERSDSPGSGVSMRDLVKASLRQAPQVIIVGEVRDDAAYDLCQALNTGHYGMSTIHANSDFDAIYRLGSLISQGGLAQGAGVLPLIAASFDLIVRIERFPTDGSRRIVSISEVGVFPKKGENGELTLPLNQLFNFVDEGLDEDLKVLGHWEKTGEMSHDRTQLRRLDLERDLTWEELRELSEGGVNVTPPEVK